MLDSLTAEQSERLRKLLKPVLKRRMRDELRRRRAIKEDAREWAEAKARLTLIKGGRRD